MTAAVTQAKKLLKEVKVKPEVWETVVVKEEDYNNIEDRNCDYLVVIETYGTA